jgi:1-acyl-sn-glycerol-3-phosphate acyltransferase
MSVEMLHPFVRAVHKDEPDSRHPFVDLAVPTTMSLYARLWHRCRRIGPNPVPVHGPALIIANHVNHADPAFLMAACSRWIHFMQAREYYDVPVLRHFFHMFGCVPVTRGGCDKTAIREALAELERGAFLGIFPEGELPSARGAYPRKGKTGAALLALRSRAPVFPAFIMTKASVRGVVADWMVPAHGVQVIFGSALDLSAYYSRRVTHQLLSEVTRSFMQSIAELTAEGSGARNQGSGARNQESDHYPIAYCGARTPSIFRSLTPDC